MQQQRNADAFQIIEKAHGRIEAQALEHHTAIPPHPPSRSEERITQLNVHLINSDDPAARAEIEQRIYQAELQMDAPRLAGLTSIHPVALGDLQRHLENGELLLEYVLGEEASYVMAVSHESVNSYSLSGKKVLETSAARYREATSKGKRPRLFLASCLQLYSATYLNIGRPLPSSLSPMETFIYSILRTLGWDEIRRSNARSSTAPSATVLDVVREERHRRDRHEFVGVAAWTAERPSGVEGVLREVTAPELKQFVLLPQSLHEVTAIAQEFPKPSLCCPGIPSRRQSSGPYH